MLIPREIKRQGEDGLLITWSDGKVHEISSKTLRINCPSADNKAKQGDTSHSKPLSSRKSLLKVVEAAIDEELRLERIDAVGNYAIRIVWGDGHNTGIYSFSFLHELGEKKD